MSILEDFRLYGLGFLEAAWIVILITVATIMLSWCSGLAAVLGRRSNIKSLERICYFYVWFMRGTPALIQVFIVYFGLPQIGIRLNPFVAGVIALGLNSGAYVSEIIRSGFLAIPRGQLESGQALGMRRVDVLCRIILPQVFRVALPGLTNEAISVLKNTSLLSTITVIDITLYAQTIISMTFRPFEFYIAASLIYLMLTSLLSRLAMWMEKRQMAYG